MFGFLKESEYAQLWTDIRGAQSGKYFLCSGSAWVKATGFLKLKYGGMHSETQGLGSEDTWIPGTLWRADLSKAAGSGPMKDQDQKKKRREEEAEEEEERRRKEESKNSKTDVNNTQRTTEVVPWPP